MRISWFGAVSLVFVTACALSVSRVQQAPQEQPKEPLKDSPKEPPKELVVKPEAPFRRDQIIEIPAEAKGLAHFVKGQMLLNEGEFDLALVEFEAAAAADPSNSFLRLRLAKLYVDKGDLQKGLKEAEEAVRLAPDASAGHLLLAGVYSSLGDNAKALKEFEEGLRIDPS